MAKKRTVWPKELRKPIIVQELAGGLFGLINESGATEYQTARANLIVSEAERRVLTIAKFLDVDLKAHHGWYWLVIKLCEHWQIPGFKVTVNRPRGPGATKTWTDKKLCELFADVMALRAKQRRMTEHAACFFIAKNAKQYGVRYRVPKDSSPKSWGSTLYRQFVTAKKQLKTSSMFRAVYLSERYQGLLGEEPPFDQGLVQRAIERYALKRELME